MRVVAKRHMPGFPTATERHARILSNDLAFRAGDCDLPPDQVRPIANDPHRHVVRHGFRRSISANVVQCAGWTFQNCVRNRIRIGRVDVDPGTAAWIEDDGECLDAGGSVNASRCKPLHAYPARGVFARQVGKNLIRFVIFGWCAGAAGSSVGFVVSSRHALLSLAATLDLVLEP